MARIPSGFDETLVDSTIQFYIYTVRNAFTRLKGVFLRVMCVCNCICICMYTRILYTWVEVCDRSIRGPDGARLRTERVAHTSLAPAWHR